MLLADTWGAVAVAAAVLAAGAALVTVLYARGTVIQAREAREDARRVHLDEMQEAAAAREAAAAQHRLEIEERRRALDAELRLARLHELGRVAGLLTGLRVIVEHEIEHGIVIGLGSRTRIPNALAELAAAVEILRALGGPTLQEAGMLGATRSGGQDANVYVGSITAALDEVEALARNDVSLRFETAEEGGDG